MSAATENLRDPFHSLISGIFHSENRLMLPLITLTLLLIQCGTLTIQSQWNDNVSIDGNAVEWQNRVTYLDNRKVAAGFMNDANYLYVCLISYDEATIRQIRQGGFSLSCTHPELGKDSIGIRFICSRRNMPPASSAGIPTQPPPSQEEASFESLEFTGPHHKKASIVPVHNIDTTTVQYRMTGTRDKLILELRMALHSDSSADSFSLGIENDTGMTIVLETTIPEGHPGGGPPSRPDGARPAHQGGGPPQGFSGGSGGPPGGMGGPPPGNGNGPPGGGRETPDPLKVKINLHLANDTDMTNQTE